jgi:hypothetical protein
MIYRNLPTTREQGECAGFYKGNFMDLYQSLINEVSMGVGGTGVPTPDIEPGTGIIVKDPIRQRKKRDTNLNDVKPLRPGSAANGGMVGVNPMIPGRSAFAKAVESLNR